MVVVYAVGDGAADVGIPNWASVEAFARYASDGGGTLYTLGGPEDRAVVGLPFALSHAGLLVLHQFRERSFKAAGLAVHVGFGRNGVVTCLHLERNSELGPCDVVTRIAAANAPLRAHRGPFLCIDPLREWMPNRAWNVELLVLDLVVMANCGIILRLVELLCVDAVVACDS